MQASEAGNAVGTEIAVRATNGKEAVPSPFGSMEVRRMSLRMKQHNYIRMSSRVKDNRCIRPSDPSFDRRMRPV